MAERTPVLDTITEMTAASAGHSGQDPREMMIARIAALVASDAPPGSYLANAGIAAEMGITQDDVQDILVAVAPIVGTAKVMSASGNLMRALGFAIAVAEGDEGASF